MDVRPAGTTTRMLGGVLVAAALLAAPLAGAQTSGRIDRASVDSLGDEALGSSGAPSLSADGRLVAFDSDAADLVPGDTNDDTDVFVRDRQTGVVERVSLAWNGNEARDDSVCPSLSSDGRFVAFRSRAWNMYPGGANLGNPRYDVYVRDRQAGTTTRLSVANGGGEPDGDSGCPSISGDGKRVVFASRASNLVASDGNGFPDVFLFDADANAIERVSRSAVDGGDADCSSDRPVISRNGGFVAFESCATNLRPTGGALPPILPFARTVFVRDLTTGVTEAASLKDDANTDYPYSPQENSWSPAISDDGRFVSFTSDAWNLVVPEPIGGQNAYVRDRTTGRTILASQVDPGETDCGRVGAPFPCAGDNGLVVTRISGDGRFVAFQSRSLRLMPANAWHGDQVYLFDVAGRRLRRLSVNERGAESNSCSVEPVLSADARVLAYRSTATNLIAGDQNGRADVFVHDWTCDDGGRCRTLAACPPAPRDCTEASDSVLRLGKRPPGGAHRDRLFWSWNGDADAPTFPDPTTSGRYQLCAYGRALALDLAAPTAASCDDTTRPCWHVGAAGYKLVNPHGGLASLRVTTINDRSRILVRGTGSLLDAPYLPVVAPDGLVVQLQETGTGRCWAASYAPDEIKRNIAGTPGDGSVRDGHLVAQLR